MRLPKPSKFHIYGYWLPMPFMLFAWCYILYGERLFTDWRVPFVVLLIIMPVCYCIWSSVETYDRFIRKKFPALEQTKQRVIYKMAVQLIMTPGMILKLYIFHWFHILGYSIGEGDIKYACLTGLTVNIIFETLWEVIYLRDKYKENVEEEELLKQMQLEQEFENLKQKVNPHFLFNCFNTLLSLINENEQQAEEFLDELSKVYRYLLRNNENELSTVEQEITFIQSYFNLLQTRFGNALHLKIKIAPQAKCCLLPSLTIQMLVENAVKHNAISRSHPMQIVIYTTTDQTLVVQNTIAKKNTKAVSTGIGLANIKDKYKLLQAGEVSIEETKEHFTVSIPLLQEEDVLQARTNEPLSVYL